jgi:hypothetical protein
MLPGPCRDKSIEVICSRDEQTAKPRLGQKRQSSERYSNPKSHVRFAPESRHVQRTSGCPLCANSGHRACGPLKNKEATD